MLAKTTFIDGTTVEPEWLNSIPARNREPLPKYIGGLELTRSSATKITVAAGAAASSNWSKYIVLDAPITKYLTSTWSAGNEHGGRASATAANLAALKWYHVFVIMNDAGAVDVGFDVVLDAANLLATSNYTHYRRIGAVFCTSVGGDIFDFKQAGNLFLWENPSSMSAGALISLSAPEDTDSTQTVLVPSLIQCRSVLHAQLAASSVDATIHLYDGALSTSISNRIGWSAQNGVEYTDIDIELLTNTSSQIKYRYTGSYSTKNIYTRGYYDPRE
jgi:hypothetical protein